MMQGNLPADELEDNKWGEEKRKGAEVKLAGKNVSFY